MLHGHTWRPLGTVYFEWRPVLRRYIARWLLVDVISTVPFDTLLALCGLAEAAGGKLLGLSRIVRLVRRAPRIGPLKVPQSIDCVPGPAPCTLRGHSFRASATGSARTESLVRLHERERLCTACVVCMSLLAHAHTGACGPVGLHC
jgi:hypothetical protein